MSYVIDDRHIYDTFTRDVRNIAQKRVQELLGGGDLEDEDLVEFIDVCGTLINIEVF